MRIILLLILVLASYVADSQGYPINATNGTATTTVLTRGVSAADSAYWFRTNYPDTTTASLGQLKNVPGAVIRVADTSLFVRNQTISRWVRIGGGSATGTLTTASQGLFVVGTDVQYGTSTKAGAAASIFTTNRYVQQGNNAAVFKDIRYRDISALVPTFPDYYTEIQPGRISYRGVDGGEFNFYILDSANTLDSYFPGVHYYSGGLNGSAGTFQGSMAMVHWAGADKHMDITDMRGSITYAAIQADGSSIADFRRTTGNIHLGLYSTAVGSRVGIGYGTDAMGQRLSVMGSGSFTDTLLANGVTKIFTRVGTSADSVLVKGSNGFTYAVLQSSIAAGSVPFNGLLAATGTNTINNGNFAQEWDWNALTSTGLVLATNGTAATNGQKLFIVSSQGANAASGVSTYSAYISNQHTGTTSENIGAFINASGATSNTGVYANASGGSTNHAVYIAGGDLATALTTLSLFNTVATTINFGGAATNITIGTSAVSLNLGGTTSASPAIVANGANVSFLLADASAYTGIAAASLLAGSTTFNLVNTNATTINFAGASGNVTNFGGGVASAEFRFLEPSGSGANYSGFKAVAQGANITYSLPATVGAAGTVLTDAAGNGVLSWAAGSATVTWNAIANPTGDQALTFDAGESSTWTNSNTTEDLFTVNTSTITTANQISLVSTSTALAAGNEMLNIAMSGINGTNAITATGARISVTNTNGTSGTNIGLAVTASGATTANIAVDAVGSLRTNSLTSGRIPYASTAGLIVDAAGLAWSNASNMLLITGTAGSVTASPDTRYLFTADANAAMDYLIFNHDNITIAYDSWWDGSAVNWKASYTSAFQLTKSADRFIIRGNSGLVAGNNFTPAEVWGISTAGDVIMTGSLVGAATFALANSVSTTINFAGAATTLNVGSTATTTILKFGGGTTASEFRFLEPSGSGTNYSAFKAVAQGADITYSLPPTVGAAGTVLTDVAGNGVLTWVAASAAVTWNGISNPTGDQALTFDLGESSTWTNANTTEDLFTVNSSTITTSSFLSLNSTATTLAAGNNIAEFIMSGANGTNAITATGLRISVTNTNATSGTNEGINVTASGATTANTAINATGSVSVTSAITTQATTAAGIALNVNSLTTGTGFYAASSSLTSGSVMQLVTTGTVKAANNEVLDIASSGANGTNAITVTGARISVTNTNATSGTNIGLDVTASGATTANYAALFTGRVGINNTTPASVIDIGTFNTTLYNFRTGSFVIQPYSLNNGFLYQNGYFDGSDFTRISTGFTSGFHFVNGQTFMANSASGSGIFIPTVSFKNDIANSGTVALGGNINQTSGDYSGASMVVLGTGNVGVGDMSPASLFTVGSGDLFQVNTTGKITFSNTITAGGTTGNQTINKPSGTVNIAAAGTTVTVTNSTVSTSSIVYCVIRTNDATARISNVVPGAGSFVINIVACTAEVSIGFIVYN